MGIEYGKNEKKLVVDSDCCQPAVFRRFPLYWGGDVGFLRKGVIRIFLLAYCLFGRNCSGVCKELEWF